MRRRDFLGRLAVVAGAGVAGPTLLAGCPAQEEEPADEPADAGALWFDNWPAYIDPETVEIFSDETGIRMRYTERINDNAEYFALITPDLAAGRPIGPDIIAPTGWLAGRIILMDFATELPLDDIPNSANLLPHLRNPAWDPEGRYSLPWQTGITGIGYNLDATGGVELRSMRDLFDPRWRGRIGLFREYADTLGLVMLMLGQNPAEATFEGAAEAFATVEAAAADGQVRRFHGNDYFDELIVGNLVANTAWSGDIFQLQKENPHLRFVIPEEGGMTWADTMLIPAGAENVANAARWMDFCYEPENAARITSYVQFVSPVAGVQEILAAGDEEQRALAESPLIFPDEATAARLRPFAVLDEEEEARFSERWATIVGA
jgi:spermidine/putrescine transport system substrate-binding protein